jgi:hypothetical protein
MTEIVFHCGVPNCEVCKERKSMKFKASKETEEAAEKRELVKKLIERRYGPFPHAGGAGRILLEAALKDQALETLRVWESSAAAAEVQRKQNQKRTWTP